MWIHVEAVRRTASFLTRLSGSGTWRGKCEVYALDGKTSSEMLNLVRLIASNVDFNGGVLDAVIKLRMKWSLEIKVCHTSTLHRRVSWRFVERNGGLKHNFKSVMMWLSMKMQFEWPCGIRTKSWPRSTPWSLLSLDKVNSKIPLEPDVFSLFTTPFSRLW